MIIIFSGYNQRAVMAFLRCLEKKHINNYVIAAASEHDTILKTSYMKKVFCIRKNAELNLDEICGILADVRKRFSADSLLIPPTTEALNRFLLENREILEMQHCIIPLVDKALYEELSDKESFWQLCRNNGLPVPPCISLNLKYTKPYVAKPRHYFSKDGNTYSPILVLSAEIHDNFMNKYDTTEFTYYEYISGNSYYLLFYFSKSGEVFCSSQENFAQQLNGKSILAAAMSKIHEQDIADKYINLFRQANYVGFVMVELREKGGSYYMIEANPRFWGPSQLFVDAGVPLFEEFLKDYRYISQVEKTVINYDAKYLWSGGCSTELINEQNVTWLGQGRQKVSGQWEEFVNADIYCRQDTMDIFESERQWWETGGTWN